VSKEDRTAVLRYGIEPEVLELVQALRQEKNTDYRDLLVTAFDNARTDELKEALFLSFLDAKDLALEDRAAAVLADPDKKANSLLLNCVSYLTDLKSPRAKDALAGLTTGKNKVLALAAVRSLGKLGATDKVDDLVKLYQDSETDPNYKPDMIWAFGEMKASATVDLLLKEYDDNEAQPLLRKVILEALGKIADPRAWDLIQGALKDSNADLRASAVAALAAFPDKGDPTDPLTAALRDPQAGVRLAGAQAAKVVKMAGLKDLLAYRTKKDPDPRVRVASLQALAVYDDGPTLVLAFLADRKTDAAVWREALNLSLDKAYPGVLDTLKGVLVAENKDKLGYLAPVIAGALLPKREPYRALFGLLLDNDKVPSRMTALRAIGLGKFTEYEGRLRELEAKDGDVGVKNQAKDILKAWNAAPGDSAKAASPAPAANPAPTAAPAP